MSHAIQVLHFIIIGIAVFLVGFLSGYLCRGWRFESRADLNLKSCIDDSAIIVEHAKQFERSTKEARDDVSSIYRDAEQIVGLESEIGRRIKECSNDAERIAILTDELARRADSSPKE
jgi:hypothetical protein